MAAAKTVLEARARNDFSEPSLSAYKQKLDKTPIMADMRTYRRAPHFFQNPRMYQDYPAMLTGLMERIYLGDGQPKEHILPMVMKTTRDSGVSLFDLMRDMLEGMRAL
jgi:electron transfer flavoprotein-quinone oxidoreductase